MVVRYESLVEAVAATGMIVRGGFEPQPGTLALADGRDVATVVMIGNVGGAMWDGFRAAESGGANPLDRWTREVLVPIADRFGADFVHPSDEPFRPFQRWAQRADDVWQSPIGLLVHRTYGLWHAYRGALLFARHVSGLPDLGAGSSPCLDCADRPCLTTCPVDAFTPEGYDAAGCADHVRSGDQPMCLESGCVARRACPVGVEHRYGPDQMQFHIRAFVGMHE